MISHKFFSFSNFSIQTGIHLNKQSTQATAVTTTTTATTLTLRRPVSRITAKWMYPVLLLMLNKYPFKISRWAER